MNIHGFRMAILFFYHVDLRDQMQFVRLGSKCLFFILSHLARPQCMDLLKSHYNLHHQKYLQISKVSEWLEYTSKQNYMHIYIHIYTCLYMYVYIICIIYTCVHIYICILYIYWIIDYRSVELWFKTDWFQRLGKRPFVFIVLWLTEEYQVGPIENFKIYLSQ